MLYRGDSKPGRPRQPRARRRHSYQYRHPAPIERAFAGAKLLLGIPIQPRTQAEAARLVASTPFYVAAAAALLEAGVPGLVDDVLQGRVPLLEAGETVRKRARLVKAYREADRKDRAALGKVVGVDVVFDETIKPLL
jgi:hypothetical protein